MPSQEPPDSPKWTATRHSVGMHPTEEASLLIMFNTHLGRYWFLCVPFRLKKCHRISSRWGWMTSVAQCPGILAIHDDVFIYGKDYQGSWCQHYKLIQCGPERRTCLQQQKVCHKTGISDILSEESSRQKDTPQIWKRSKASQKWHHPRWNRSYSPSLVQWITCRHLFLISAATQRPSRALLKKENSFAWGENSNMYFQKIKCLLQKALLKPLRYYDQSKLVTLQCDASLKGLGAYIIQDGHPISFHQQISDMDTETWVCQHQEGTPSHCVQLWQVPHVPVWEDIHRWNRPQTPGDDQPEKSHSSPLWGSRGCSSDLQQYDMVITYRPGKEMLLADALSHLPSRTDTEICLDLRVNAILMYAFSPRCLTKIRTETQWDPILSTVHRITLNGWPDRQGRVPQAVRYYWSFWDKLSINRDLLTKGEWVVIPPSCRHSIMTNLHGNHASIKKAMDLARTCIYWLGMEADITDYIKRCLMCIECSNLPMETLHPHEVPPEPWVKIGVDFFQDHLGKKHLIVANYFSKFPYVFPVVSSHHFKTINHLRELFAAEGVPSTVMSDNGPPFNGEEFRQFTHDFDFVHKTSSPHFPQSNGFIEAMVKKVKNTCNRKLMDHPMLNPEHYSSYVIHPFQQIFLPQLKLFMDALHKEQFFQDHQNLSTYIRFGRNSSKFRISRRKILTKPTEPKIFTYSRLRSKYSSSPANKEQAPWNGWQAQWPKSWIVDVPTWSRPLMAKSTDKIELIWSPYVMMEVPFKTIWWKRRWNSP